MFLGDDFGRRATLHPQVGEESATAVGRLFFQAGRFVFGEFAKSVDNLREKGSQELQKSFGK